MKNAGYITIVLIISSAAVAFAGFGNSIIVNVHTGPSLDYFYWINATNNTITTEEHLQKYLISWENIGSVSCKTRAGVYIFKANSTGNLSAFDNIYDIEYIAWSQEYDTAAGRILTIELNSPLPEGKYIAKVRVYYCNEVLEFGPYNVTVSKRADFDNNTIKISHIDYFDNYIEFKATADRNIDKVYAYPLNYPFGWIIEQNYTKIEAGKESTIRIDYQRPAKQEGNVKIRFASNDSITDAEISIENIQPDNRYLIILALAIVFAAGIFILYKLRSKR